MGDRVVVSKAVVEQLLPAGFRDTVYSEVRNHAIIVGVRWAGDERHLNREEWLYTVRSFVPVPPEHGITPWSDVYESQILDVVERKNNANEVYE